MLSSRVHETIKDRTALNDIKNTKFISSIPATLRIKLEEENIFDYDVAVERAQILQNIMQNETIMQSCTSTTAANSISAQLQLLTGKVNALTLTNTQKVTKRHIN